MILVVVMVELNPNIPNLKMNYKDIVITSAGLGSRFEPISTFANKSLAPVPFLPVIIKTIDQIPADFTIHILTSTHSHGSDLRCIIELFRPQRKILFYEAPNPHTYGMADSLSIVLNEISAPLVVIPNDGLYGQSFISALDCLSLDHYTVGFSPLIPGNYLNLSVDSNHYINGISR